MTNSILKYGISLIIPTYQGKSNLTSCFNSVFNQTLSPQFFEVIVVLNGDDDGSLQLLEDISEKHSNYSINIIYIEHSCVSNARNVGVSTAKYEYIVFLDDDDRLSCAYLEKLLNYARKDAVVLCSLVNIKNSKNKRFLKVKNKFEFIYSVSVILRTMTMNACKIIPTQLINQFKFDTNLRSSEDMVLYSAMIISRSIKFKVVPSFENAAYFRRIRESSISWQSISFDFNVIQRIAVIKSIWCHIDNRSQLLNPIKLLFFISRVFGEIFYSLRIIGRTIINKVKSK